jgi:hypothetical protein
VNSGPSSAASKPRFNDHMIWDLIFPFWGTPAVLVAHDLGLFSLLGKEPHTLGEICKELKLAPRAAEALLQMNVAYGLIEARDDTYRLAPVAEEYLVESSPVALCGYLDYLVANSELWSVKTLKNAVLTNSPQVAGGRDLFTTREIQEAFAKVFTRAMHAHSMGAALTWPDTVDLSEHRAILDVGGGSGAHMVGVLLRYPNLKGILLDTPSVITEAEQYIGRFGLGDRIRVLAADMWTDPFPHADVHLYCDIFHDWPKDKGQFLARKSFESLPSGGKIILREVLFDDARTGPVAAAAYSVNMLLITQGGQFSKREIRVLLTETGFHEVQMGPPGAGYRNLIQAQKP